MTEPLCRALLRWSARLVPRRDRDRWLAEWNAEMRHAWGDASGGVPTWRRRATLTRHVLGAMRHAAWMRMDGWRSATQRPASDSTTRPRPFASLGADVRTAIRTLRATPGFTITALIVLTLGIGATTAIFSVVDAVVLRGLPFDESDRLMSIGERLSSTGQIVTAEAAPNYFDWRHASAFDGIAAVAYGDSGYILRRPGGAMRIRTKRVTYELFPVLRVAPLLGRTFTAEEEDDGRERVAVISFGFWQQEFGGDPDVVGRTMTLDRGTYQVIGVMPAGFTYPIGADEPPQMWVPYVASKAERVRGSARAYYLQLVGRLKPGVSIDQARAELQAITGPLATTFPDWFYGGRVANVQPLHGMLVGRVRPWMLMLLGAVAVVLLIACVNVANLMLARATSRSRELGIRAALGASRWQIARGLLVESLLLSFTGAALGLLVAHVGVALLRNAMPVDVPRLSDIGINLRVLAASAAAAAVTGVLFGLAPALQFSRPDLNQTLRDGGRASTAGAAKQRLRSALVIGEVALAVVLLVGTGLFVSSFARVMRIELGIDDSHVLTFDVPFEREELSGVSDMSAAERLAIEARRTPLLEAMLVRIQSTPGVERAAILNGGVPLSGGSQTRDAKALTTGRTVDSIEFKRVTPDYHAVFRIPLHAGRLFTPADRHGSASVAILNDVAAADLFGSAAAAIGQTVNSDGEHTVVGVVGAVRQLGPETPPPPEIYTPFAQTTTMGGTLVIRTIGDPMAVVPAIKRAVLSVLPGAVFPEPATMTGYAAKLVAQRRFNMLLFSLFGLLGVVIAVVGIYGVMGYLVAQRTPEFGVRLALGAARGQVLRMVLSRAAVFMIVGLAAGLGTAYALSRFVKTFLFDVTPSDPAVYAAVAFVLVAAGLIAAFTPALRASRVDPIVTLRAE
ncbi:MAG TPA: ABC transporter permease [Vicinamibacterales bacterium]|nr:ABC transporter permease [Vicinamibacterales bacterium]